MFIGLGGSHHAASDRVLQPYKGENEAFARLIVAIEPWLGEVVIVGGWAHQSRRDWC
jgi:hypothetical protein